MGIKTKGRREHWRKKRREERNQMGGGGAREKCIVWEGKRRESFAAVLQLVSALRFYQDFRQTLPRWLSTVSSLFKCEWNWENGWRWRNMWVTSERITGECTCAHNHMYIRTHILSPCPFSSHQHWHTQSHEQFYLWLDRVTPQSLFQVSVSLFSARTYIYFFENSCQPTRRLKLQVMYVLSDVIECLNGCFKCSGYSET